MFASKKELPDHPKGSFAPKTEDVIFGLMFGISSMQFLFSFLWSMILGLFWALGCFGNTELKGQICDHFDLFDRSRDLEFLELGILSQSLDVVRS